MRRNAAKPPGPAVRDEDAYRTGDRRQGRVSFEGFLEEH